jgi:hypothetical protein
MILTSVNFTESFISKHGDWHNALLSPPSAMAGLFLTSLMQQLTIVFLCKQINLHMRELYYIWKKKKTSCV